MAENDMVEKVARAIMEQDCCGYTLNDEWVFCDDIRLLGELDPYGKPLYFGSCDCREKAVVAIGAYEQAQRTALSH